MLKRIRRRDEAPRGLATSARRRRRQQHGAATSLPAGLPNQRAGHVAFKEPGEEGRKESVQRTRTRTQTHVTEILFSDSGQRISTQSPRRLPFRARNNLYRTKALKPL